MNLITTDGYPAYEEAISQRLRGDRHAASDRQTWSSQGFLQSRAARPHLRRGGEDTRERAGW